MAGPVAGARLLGTAGWAAPACRGPVVQHATAPAAAAAAGTTTSAQQRADLLPVLQLRALAAQLEHGHLSLLQRGVWPLVKAGRVLHAQAAKRRGGMGAQNELWQWREGSGPEQRSRWRGGSGRGGAVQSARPARGSASAASRSTAQTCLAVRAEGG